MEDTYVAFCLDQATAYWGRSIEMALDEVDDKDIRVVEMKRKRILENYLEPTEPGSAPKKGQFADPAQLL